MRYKHLFSQVNYKLAEYSKAMQTYISILNDNKGEIENEDISDIMVNYLACLGSTGDGSADHALNMFKEYDGLDKTYEYFFNLSQVFLKEGNNTEAYSYMR